MKRSFLSQVEAQRRQRAAAEARQRAEAQQRATAQARQRAAAEAQRQHAERTRAVFEKTGLDEGVQVQVDGAGFGTVVGVTTGSKIRVRVGRSAKDFSRDQLRVVASDDAAPASPATSPSDELTAPAPAPTPDAALDAAVAPAPVAPPPCADQVDELAALLQSIQVRGGVPPGYESMLAEALRLLRVVDAAGRAGDDAAPLRPVHAAQAALPSLAADLVAPPAARPHAVETPPAPAPMAMDEEPVRTASPEPSEDAAAAASPVAATAVAPTRLAAAASQPSTTATPAPAPNPMIIRISKPESLRRKPRRSARQTPRLAAPAATAPPARKRRRAPARAPAPSPSVASPEPTAPDASAPAQGSGKRPKRSWTPAEDDKLVEARRRLLASNDFTWVKVAEAVDTRDRKDCRERWVYQLNPEINKSEFTAEEDAYLLALPQTGKWWSVARALPGPGGRTDMAVKNRYHTLMKTVTKARQKRKR